MTNKHMTIAERVARLEKIVDRLDNRTIGMQRLGPSVDSFEGKPDPSIIEKLMAGIKKENKE